MVNESPEADGWFVKIKVDDPAEVENLMDESSYEEHISKRISTKPCKWSGSNAILIFFTDITVTRLPLKYARMYR